MLGNLNPISAKHLPIKRNVTPVIHQIDRISYTASDLVPQPKVPQVSLSSIFSIEMRPAAPLWHAGPQLKI